MKRVGIRDAIKTIMSDIRSKPSERLSAAQVRALKKRLRSLRWQPEAVMREIVLIKRLRMHFGEMS